MGSAETPAESVFDTDNMRINRFRSEIEQMPLYRVLELWQEFEDRRKAGGLKRDDWCKQRAIEVCLHSRRVASEEAEWLAKGHPILEPVTRAA